MDRLPAFGVCARLCRGAEDGRAAGWRKAAPSAAPSWRNARRLIPVALPWGPARRGFIPLLAKRWLASTVRVGFRRTAPALRPAGDGKFRAAAQQRCRVAVVSA